MPGEQTENELLREEVRQQKEEAAERERRAKQIDLLKNRVSVAAIIITTALSFIGNVRSNRSGTVDGSRAAAESARRQSAELWAYYQTKLDERTALELARDRIRLDLRTRGAAEDDPTVKSEVLQVVGYEERIREFEDDAQLVFYRVQDLEKEEDLSVRKTAEPALAVGRYDLGSKLMTLALILLSVTILSNKSWLFWAGSALGAIGMLVAFDGYFLFF
jgi:Domain of unknown function (DUF4337)